MVIVSGSGLRTVRFLENERLSTKGHRCRIARKICTSFVVSDVSKMWCVINGKLSDSSLLKFRDILNYGIDADTLIDEETIRSANFTSNTGFHYQAKTRSVLVSS